MKKLYLCLTLFSLFGCGIPKEFSIKKTFSEKKAIQLSDGDSLNLSDSLTYEQGKKGISKFEFTVSMPSKKVVYSLKQPRTRGVLKNIFTNNRIRNRKLRKIAKNAFLELELYKLPIEDQDLIKSGIKAFNSQIANDKKHARKLIRTNKKLLKKNIEKV